MAYKILSRFADTVGDGSGTINAIGDYSGTPTIFKVEAGTEHIDIARMVISYEAATLNSTAQYGSGAALTNGIDVFVQDADGNIIYYLTDENHNIKRNPDWPELCFDFNLYTGFASGDDFVVVRWTFARSGVPVELLPGWALCVLLQDNMTTGGALLTHQHFLVQGRFRDLGSQASGVHA